MQKLFQHPLHKEAEETDSVLRLRFKLTTSKPQKTDCINQLIQLQFLYKAMETRLADLKEEKLLSIFATEPWANRSDKLRFDIQTMIASLSENEKEDICTACSRIY